MAKTFLAAERQDLHELYRWSDTEEIIEKYGRFSVRPYPTIFGSYYPTFTIVGKQFSFPVLRSLAKLGYYVVSVIDKDEIIVSKRNPNV